MEERKNENVIWNSSKLFCGIFFWKGIRIFRDIIRMGFVFGGGYLLVEHWDSITVWMHSLNIVQGLDGYEDMSNGFIFVCLVVSAFIFMMLLPIFAIVLIVGLIIMNIVVCTLVLLTTPSTYTKRKIRRVSGNEYNSSIRWIKW